MAMSRSGKVKGQTPRMEKEDVKKKKKGRSGKRKLLNKRVARDENKEPNETKQMVEQYYGGHSPKKKRNQFNKKR